MDRNAEEDKRCNNLPKRIGRGQEEVVGYEDRGGKVAQARAAIEDTTTDCTSVPVILTAMQQRICNLLGEATIISLPTGDPDAEITLPVTMSSVTTVTLTESTFVIRF